MLDISLSDVLTEYVEAIEQACYLYEEHQGLPYEVHRALVQDLYKTCRRELKFKCKLNARLAKDDYIAALRFLNERLAKLMPKKDKPSEQADTSAPKNQQEQARLPETAAVQQLPSSAGAENADTGTVSS